MENNKKQNQDSQAEIVIKINLEELFNNKQCHTSHDPGTVIYYVIKVNKSEFEVKESKLTGRQLLALVGQTPETHRIFEIGDGHREISPDEYADFTKKGIERFKSVAKFANEGSEVAIGATSPLMREIELPLDDKAFLDNFSAKWETFLENGAGWIILHDFTIPSGYNVDTASVAFLIPASYPNVEFDMMYFFPHLKRVDGNDIGALSEQNIRNLNFQRWSRHRNAGVWTPGIDNLETHVLSVQMWLKDELFK